MGTNLMIKAEFRDSNEKLQNLKERYQTEIMMKENAILDVCVQNDTIPNGQPQGDTASPEKKIGTVQIDRVNCGICYGHVIDDVVLTYLHSSKEVLMLVNEMDENTTYLRREDIPSDSKPQEDLPF